LKNWKKSKDKQFSIIMELVFSENVSILCYHGIPLSYSRAEQKPYGCKEAVLTGKIPFLIFGKSEGRVSYSDPGGTG
jgi:hypothetical protein